MKKDKPHKDIQQGSIYIHEATWRVEAQRDRCMDKIGNGQNNRQERRDGGLIVASPKRGFTK